MSTNKVRLGVTFRLCERRYWFAPVGVSLGIKNARPKMARANATLEKAYQQCKKFKHKQVRLGRLTVAVIFLMVKSDAGVGEAGRYVREASRKVAEVEASAGPALVAC